MTGPHGRQKEPWNHNIAYFPLIEKTARERPRRSALDVGSGDGMLAARLARSVPLVVGLDLHQDQVDGAAVTYGDRVNLRFLCGDFLTSVVAGEPFDFVACSATIHHVDLRAGLTRLRDLTAGGGTLVIVGLANNSTVLDWIFGGLSVLPVRIARARRGWHEHGAPKRDPQQNFREVRAAISVILPGAHFRRRFYWRYSVVWNNPNVSN